MYSYLRVGTGLCALLAVVITLGGCATADVIGSEAMKYFFAPDPTIVKADVRVSTDVNPDSQGRPSPIKVRFYLLESTGVFKTADFFQLKEQDRELMNEETRLREERVFKPGAEQQIELSLPAEEVPDEAKLYLAVMAGYWDLDHSEWRAVREVEIGEDTDVVVEIARSDVLVRVVY